jgi:hypothetical protein
MAVFGQLDLWRLAGKRSYERGEQYVDAVGELTDVPDGVVATVRGTELYQVRLTWAAPGLTGDCSCPWGQDGEFCKHCVAVGLAVLDAADDDDAAGTTTTTTTDATGAAEDGADVGGAGGAGGDDELRRYLTSLDHAALVELLCERAAQDADLDRTLRRRAARGAAHRGSPDMAAGRS